MDSKLKIECFRDIHHNVFDLNETVSVPQLPKLLNCELIECSKLLVEWCKEQHENKELRENYLIRGLDKNGNLKISIVPSKRISIVRETLENVTEIVYSIQTLSSVDRIMSTNPIYEGWINLSLKNSEKTKPILQKAIPAVSENLTLKTKDMPVKKGDNLVEHKNNVDESLLCEEEPKQDIKGLPKEVKSKGSISSFFSKKTLEQDKEKIEIKPEANEEIITNKRSLQNSGSEKDENKCDNKQPKKKIKHEMKKIAKRSRIMQVCSSSDEEAENEENKNVLSNDAENKEDIKSETIENNNTEDSISKIRRKSFRTVAKTYEDEDGFLITTKVQEEYSLSEEEGNEAENKNQRLKSPIKENTVKVQPKPVKKSKQGSIKNFFTKT